VSTPFVGRHVAPWSVLAVLALLALLAAAIGLRSQPSQQSSAHSSAPKVFPLVTGFGGYTWHGHVDEIEGRWTVPSIVSSGANEAESTWIGAQGPGKDVPFIQLGTTGNISSSPFLGSNGAPGGSISPSHPEQASYTVFWSDTARGYSPIPLVQLRHPGDLISFQMKRTADGWRLSVWNLTAGWSRSITVRYGASDSFSYGEWFQEDPGGYSPGTDAPYAKTTTVSISEMKANGKDPKLGYSDGQALSTQDGVDLIPTKVAHDGFTLVTPSSAGVQYLNDAQQTDSVATHLESEMADWSFEGDATRNQAHLVQEFARLYAGSARHIMNQTWSTRVRPQIDQLASDNLQLAGRLTRWAQGAHPSLSELDTIFHSNSERSVQEARKVLGLPPV
jgi:hypothetical protein